MAQSLNKTVELHTTGVSYMAIGGKVGKFLIGDVALEFYPDVNVEQYIQIPWTSITQIGANVSGKRISRHFEVLVLFPLFHPKYCFPKNYMFRKTPE